ncbi:hypothetical protein FSP39_008161 [Pinctada imbricata]|uniref:Neurotransmitter-gated ion-channel ligand-binding domain-containing protein n=1 Tax=Pinctada imbricata TaxID=66713 RepID=A0AA89CAN1_PINIB|nr:hypothetical protein FSP39_008161 [Pinctada imbricata]
MGDWYFGTLLLYMIFTYTHGYSYHDHSRLNHDLLQNYDPRVRGSLNSSETSHIGVEFYLTSILDYEEISGKFTFVGYFVFTWFDERLKWNTSDYNGINMTRLYQSEVWHPSIAPTSSAREMRSFGNEWMLISFLSSGQGFWGPGDIFSSVCHADVTKYPFDIQHKIKLVLTIQRESTFYVVGLILPITLLTMLNLLVFLLPVESGERISYSITVLLAMTVFLTIASDNLPPTSKPGLPLLCIKLLY